MGLSHLQNRLFGMVARLALDKCEACNESNANERVHYHLEAENRWFRVVSMNSDKFWVMDTPLIRASPNEARAGNCKYKPVRGNL